MDYIEGDDEARVNEVSATAVAVPLNRLTVCDAVSELAAIIFKNTSRVVEETSASGWIELQREASEAYRGRG